MNREEIIKILEKELPYLKERYKVRSIGIFGSYVRGEAKNTSDIDILVEFEEGHKTFDNYIELKFYLEGLLGLKVDLLSRSAVKPILKDKILREVRYVEGYKTVLV